MQRRAELARSMINKPEVIILDEPFRGLDAMTKRLMQQYYANLYEEFRRTTFFVTTDIDEAIYLADRILIMANIPTQVRAVIEVDLPRPRQIEDITENDAANAIKMKALGLLARRGDEVVRAWQQGGRRFHRCLCAAHGKRLAGRLSCDRKNHRWQRGRPHDPG